MRQGLGLAAIARTIVQAVVIAAICLGAAVAVTAGVIFMLEVGSRG